jgi:hypothetical protein
LYKYSRAYEIEGWWLNAPMGEVFLGLQAAALVVDVLALVRKRHVVFMLQLQFVLLAMSGNVELANDELLALALAAPERLDADMKTPETDHRNRRVE